MTTRDGRRSRFDVDAAVESLGTRLWENIKGGNLGSAPVIFGLTIIVIVFGFTAQNFFTAVNFNNIITQMAARRCSPSASSSSSCSARSTSRSRT